jgi:serine/arginine repetitive matrix protein 2
MYNGIGLRTVRGSGTNGYVQKNRSHVPAAMRRKAAEINRGDDMRMEFAGPGSRDPNNEIMEHNRKRQIELECFELQTKMEDQGYPDDEVQRKVAQVRAEKLAAGAHKKLAMR